MGGHTSTRQNPRRGYPTVWYYNRTNEVVHQEVFPKEILLYEINLVPHRDGLRNRNMSI